MNQELLKILVTLAIGSYVGWGIAHHARQGDLCMKVIWEYLGLAGLGLIIVWGVIKYL